MPNWVANKLKTKGSFSDFVDVIKRTTSIDEEGEEFFDFEKIIPMPQELNITSGSNSELAYAYYMIKNYGTNPNGYRSEQEVVEYVEKTSKKPIQDMLELGEKIYNNVQKYGAKDWYSWCCNNWGTKWNSCHCSIDHEHQVIYFDTAWSAPIPIYDKLAGLFPNTEMSIVYADEDIGNNTGRIELPSGKFEQYAPCCSDAYKAYVECWGEDEYITIDEAGNYVYKDPYEDEEDEEAEAEAAAEAEVS